MASLVASVEAEALLPPTDTDTRDGLEVAAAAAAAVAAVVAKFAVGGVGAITSHRFRDRSTPVLHTNLST